MRLIEGFVEDSENLLPATVSKFSIREAWKQSHPPGTPEDVDEYLRETVARVYYYSFYHSTDGFRRSYTDSYDGQLPYAIPFVQERWAKGAAVSGEEHAEATQRIHVYKDWLLDTMFANRNGRGDGGDVFVVLPLDEAVPTYRDEPTPSPLTQSALDELFLPSILGALDIAILIGDVAHHSKISKKTEYLPVMLDIMGRPGSDLRLLRAIEKVMGSAGRPTVVATGSRIFPA